MEQLDKAAAILKRGGIVIFPTDTVYGFLADATNKKAVEKIYKIKKRPKSKPLSLFVKNITMAKMIADINTQQQARLKKYWPGKYTFILKLKVKSQKSKLYGLKKDTLAIRIPKHSFLQKLLKKVNKPLAQTSVNISETEPLNSLSDILTVFGKNKLVNLIIDGGTIKKAKPSRIVDLTHDTIKILRP